MSNIEFYELGGFKKSKDIEYKQLKSIINLRFSIDYEISRKDTVEILSFLDKLGVDYFWNGSVHRIDDYTFLLEGVDNIEIRGLIGYCDKKYIPDTYAVGKPNLKKNVLLEEYGWIRSIADKAYKVPIIGPYTFSTRTILSSLIRERIKEMPIKRIAYLNSKLEYTVELSKLINKMLKQLGDEGAKVFQINELSKNIMKYEHDIYLEGLNEVVSNIWDKTILYLGYISDRLLTKIIERIRFKSIVIPVAHLNKENITKLIELLNEYDIGVTFGILKADNINVEDPKELLKIIKIITSNYKGNYLSFSPDAPLCNIDRNIAYSKLFNLYRALEKI